MNRNLDKILVCPRCSAQAFRVEEYEASDSQVHEGRLICTACGTWFRIEHGVADLLPTHLRREDLYRQFAERHGIRETAVGDAPREEFKASQIQFFKSHVESYEEDVVNQPLYIAFGEVRFLRWIGDHLSSGDSVLDLGCGTGQPCLDLARKGIRVVGVDIAEEMLALGQKKAAAEHLDGLIDFIAADAEAPPVAPGSFRASLFLGALHHLPDPAKAIVGAARSVAPGGWVYSQDPHDSALRFLFDWLMKVKKLYDEEARDEPLLSERQLRDWMTAAGLDARTRLSIYLPPHLFAVLSVPAAARLLKVSDAFFGAIPGVRRWAGYVIAEGTKRG